MPRKDSAGTPATVALTAAGVPFSVHTYEHDPAAQSFGLEAAEVLGLPAEQVFKTLLVDCGSELAVAVVPVEHSLDLKAMAAAVGVKKVAMAAPEEAMRSTGMVVGGISPLGQRRALVTVIDQSALDHPSVLVSAGRRGMDIELAPHDLITLTSASVADIATA